MTTWILLILLFAPDGDRPSSTVEREFPTEALCRQEQAHLVKQALPAGAGGRLIVSCEPRVKG